MFRDREGHTRLNSQDLYYHCYLLLRFTVAGCRARVSKHAIVLSSSLCRRDDLSCARKFDENLPFLLDRMCIRNKLNVALPTTINYYCDRYGSFVYITFVIYFSKINESLNVILPVVVDFSIPLIVAWDLRIKSLNYDISFFFLQKFFICEKTIQWTNIRTFNSNTYTAPAFATTNNIIVAFALQ